MKREDIAKDFYIEDHALLYGLMGKHAEELCGEKGIRALEDATVLYGRERGLRMAMRAEKNRDELSMRNYLIYGEWTDDRGLCSSRVASLAPRYRTESLRCEWCNTWDRYGLMKYGRIYCTYIDKNLVKGFNPQNELLIDGSLSKGDPCCGFEWVGADYNISNVLNTSNLYADELNNVAQELIQVDISASQLTDIVENHIFTIPDNSSDRVANNIKQLRDEFYTRYLAPDLSEFRNTAWGVIQASADYASHHEPKRNTSAALDSRFENLLTGASVLSKTAQLLLPAA